jgi:hypothetical protein
LKSNSITSTILLFFAAYLCPGLQAGEMILTALLHEKPNGMAESAAFREDAMSGTSFAIYCNDLVTMPIGRTSAGRALLDGYFLGQMSDLGSQITDHAGGTGPVLAAYDRAARLALSFAQPSTPDDSVAAKQTAQLHEALWRLFLSTRKAGANSSPAAAVDWMLLANDNSSSFDYSRWRF